jgi:SAM-dependent methyltransferase
VIDNVDSETVRGFGHEWQRFAHDGQRGTDLEREFHAYFGVFPWAGLPESPVGLDMGCGSGGWARFVAPRVGTLHCVDASPEAVEVARRNLALHTNCHVATGTFGDNQLQPESLDFAYCLGVVHHTPDPASAIASIVPLLKPGAPLLLYIYYALDNRPLWYRSIWRMSDRLRRVICRLPFPLRSACAEMVAFSVYWPLARAAAVGERLGARVEDWPLAFYRDKQLYVLRTDALDRLGTRLEHRFTRAEIAGMLKWAGLENLVFSDAEPFWVVLGRPSPAPGKNGSITCAE